ncbi:helix-turn-helix domain-containing protein [Nonomuraea sp. NN258]|uniref:AraC family transcriptional regulator n=1 Tax=Nonomuraea antri TaxID=2730852 RepID=UPI001569EE26|nr:AraC family transcriptional regulator [Nonomuraea antri]NRQ33109.1 helix-turn-helix domain-containing protein [Nonomuraea antri]
MITAAPYPARVWLRAAMSAGLDRSQARLLPGLTVLHEDGIRIPATAVYRIAEASLDLIWAAGGAERVLELCTPGAMGVWEYQFDFAATLTEALRSASRHMPALGTPDDKFLVERDVTGVTVRWHAAAPVHPSYPLISEAFAALLVAKASSVAGRPVRPSHIGLPGPAPRRHRRLIELCGTRRVDFGTGVMSVTFTEADADAPLPGADPVLAAILDRHAEMAVITARHVLGWMDRFHTVLEKSLAAGPPDLMRVARTLALSPRTLQRRLREEGTSWRAEVELMQQRRVDRLLRETALSMDVIAAQVGYSDARALRRAVRRWHGQGPAAVRRATATER